MDHVHQIVEYGGKVVFHRNDFNLPGLDLREVQHVVDNAKQCTAGVFDAFRIGKDVVVPAFPQDHLVHAEYRIDWRADFVGHIREERGFRFAGGHGPLRYVDQLVPFLLFLVDVLGQQQHTLRSAVLFTLGHDESGPKPFPVHSQEFGGNCLYIRQPIFQRIQIREPEHFLPRRLVRRRHYQPLCHGAGARILLAQKHGDGGIAGLDLDEAVLVRVHVVHGKIDIGNRGKLIVKLLRHLVPPVGIAHDITENHNDKEHHKNGEG